MVMRGNAALACLLLLAAPFCCPGQNKAQHPSVIASLRFQSEGAGKCLATVTQYQVQDTGEPRQRLMITCMGKQVARFDTSGFLVDWAIHYPDGNRLFARWERGTGGELTVFKITPSSPAKPIFDKWEAYIPDMLYVPDVVLVYRGLRMVGALKTPTQTDVYEWDGSQYELRNSWKWNEKMRYEDRFCVLDTRSLNCPATPVTPKSPRVG
jgi:hypothetical protein